MKNNLKKDFFWNTLGTGLNAFSSLLFLIIVTRINGISDAGIFTFAFSMACLFYIIGIYNGRIYQITEKNNISNRSFIYAKIITCSVMMIITLIYLFIKQYSLEKSLIIFLLCLLKMLEAFSEVIYGVLQKNNLLYKTGISFTLKNIFGILAFFCFELFTKNLVISIFCVLIVHILVGIFYDYKNLAKYQVKKENLNISHIKNILRLGKYPFFISFFSLFIVNSPKYAIDNLFNNSSQAIFGIIIMPATIVSLIAQFVIYPFISKINEYINNNNRNQLFSIAVKITLSILLAGFICFICASFLGIPILEIIYGLELDNYRLALMIIMIGATFNACIYVMSNILIAMRNMKIQSIIYISVSIISYIASQFLVAKFGIYGACYSYTIIMLLLIIIYSYITIKSINKLREEIKK